MTTAEEKAAVLDAKFKRMPLAELMSAEKLGPLMVYRDHWWAIDDDGNVFFFNSKSYSPQCNSNRLIVERHMVQGLATSIRFVPWAYVKFDIRDYE